MARVTKRELQNTLSNMAFTNAHLAKATPKGGVYDIPEGKLLVEDLQIVPIKAEGGWYMTIDNKSITFLPSEAGTH